MSSVAKPRGLFLNPAKANCSIHESGKMVYDCLKISDKYSIDYMEVSVEQRRVPLGYDFYAFNYHHETMGWLDTKSLTQLSGLKLTFVLETLRNNPFVLCPPNVFDVYCALDPTMNVADKRVHAFPRPLELASEIKPFQKPEIPVIGSFGFATPGKGFELVVDAVNKEFDKAKVRINIPLGTYADPAFFKIHNRDYAEYLIDVCQRVAKDGVEVEFTREYMNKDALIQWCGQNTLNCFLYNRNQPGLSATTDQAISSGRPLAVSDNETFRHIHNYVKPFPFCSLKDSIENSTPAVMQMQKDWSPSSFSEQFEKVLLVNGIFDKEIQQELQQRYVQLGIISNSPLRKINRVAKRLKSQLISSEFVRKLGVQSENTTSLNQLKGKDGLPVVVFVSHKQSQCGIQQYGINLSGVLSKSEKYNFIYAECSNPTELDAVIAKSGASAIIYNYYPATMNWLTSNTTRRYDVPQLGIMHEVTQQEADSADQEMFDYHLCPDPTLIESNPIVFKTRRIIPPYINTKNTPDVVRVGSFGFGFADKGFERLINQVQDEFDYAEIALHLPFNDIVDKKGRNHALATAQRCHGLIRKETINLSINHRFLTKPQLLDFLASNSINAFFYDTQKHRGISSTIEHALAVQRPLAITKCGMFRHVFSANPSICIEDSSLQQILSNGIAPLVPFYNEWSEANFVLDYERILDAVIKKGLRCKGSVKHQL